MGIDGAKHAGVDLIHEFLTIVGVTFRRHPEVGGIFQCRHRRFHGDDGHAILQTERGKTAGHFLRRHGVSNAQTCETVDFGECPDDNNARIVERIIQGTIDRTTWH